MADINSALYATYNEVIADGKRPESQFKSDFLKALKAKGGFKQVPGGAKLEFVLDAELTTGGYISTPMASIGTAENDTLAQAVYEFAEIVVPLNISYKTHAVNSSDKNRKVDFVMSAVQNIKDSHDLRVETALFAAAATNGQESFLTLATADGTGTIGTIVSGTDLYWKSNAVPANTNGSDIEVASGALYDLCSNGSTGEFKPNLIVSGSETRSLYTATLENRQRFWNEDKAKGSFDSIMFRNADWVSSSVFTGDDAIFFNTQVTKLFAIKGFWRFMTPTTEHLSAAATNRKLISMTQLCTSKRNSMGRLVVA